jgi:hypothetical protein
MSSLRRGAEGALASPQRAVARWRDELGLLAARIRHARRLDLYLARLLGRPLPDRLYLQLGHLLYFGNWPDLDRPRTLNEHIMAYMLRCRDPLLQVAADKARARRYIAERIGAQYLVPLHGLWHNADDVPLETLPRPCVLKPTAASGMVMFLRQGDAIDPGRVRARLRRWLRRDYGRFHREWAYHGAQQAILAEPMLGDGRALPPDYKLWVIGGKVRFIQVDRGRFVHHTRNLYRPDWQLLPARLTLENHEADSRPPCLEEMVQIAERLARPLEFLRVDGYVLDGRFHVGELTGTPGAGFEKFIPSSYAYELGSCWTRCAQSTSGVSETAPSDQPALD